ncbi:HNH endonuclease [Novosphingobium sp. UBA1939]|uniref:HNH endonuclease n=1 Tax=Novosphingobium sp. UBA1939 TaxID=1946982 RepID=UPI0025DDB295|nr:HNH endonuclease [Novosphingobium sp. UBA1939]
MKAIAEYDRIGQQAFYEKYGFRDATAYWLVHNGKRYASKAIANVAQAHGMRIPYDHRIKKAGGVPLIKRLRAVGFTVIESNAAAPPTKPNLPRNDTWTREELILALDLYMQSPSSPAGKDSPKVAKLTEILRKLAVLKGGTLSPTFRNANGVYLKMMNFRRFDPAFLQQGKRGMQRGGKLDALVWNEFANNRPALKQAATLIRETLDDPLAWAELLQTGDGADEAEEGSVTHRMHKRYERNRQLTERKKAKVFAAEGALRCECCKFDFSKRYGKLGEGYIEAHHKKPVFQMKPGEKTKLDDLALVCANCHRMLHRQINTLTIEDLVSQIR